MGETFCQKYWWCCAAFFISLLCVNIYLFYAGWWLPIDINRHRLRYSQLDSFEIYTFKHSDWDRYHVRDERISMLNYIQQQPLEYRYLLGIFEADLNFTSIDEDIIDNATWNDLGNGTLIQLGWNYFSDIIDDSIPNDKNFFIIQYSATDCRSNNDTDYINSTEIDIGGFEECLIKWWEAKNGTDPPHYLIYTPILDILDLNVNSYECSQTFDGPRDTFMFLIMCAMFIWLFLMMDAMEDPSIGWDGLNFTVITLFFIGVYYLWVFCTSVVPIQFSFPVFGEPHMEYYVEVAHSLAYTFGDYDPRWWVAGVLLHGLWCYFLVLFIPILGILFFVIACACCCDEDRIDKYGSWPIVLLLILGLMALIMMTITFFIIFLGNLSYWNDNTYTPADDPNVIQSIVAILTIYVLVPFMGCLIAAVSKYDNDASRKGRGDTKYLHRVGTSMTKLPMVKNRVSNTHTKVHDNPADDAQETVAMTKHTD